MQYRSEAEDLRPNDFEVWVKLSTAYCLKAKRDNNFLQKAWGYA